MTQEPTIAPGGAAETRVLTLRQADLPSPSDAIERWRVLPPTALHLDEPLTRWQPVSIHLMILAGATPAEVCAAAGASPREVFDHWQRWVEVQRHLMIGGRPSVSEEEYIRVPIKFADACKAA